MSGVLSLIVGVKMDSAPATPTYWDSSISNASDFVFTNSDLTIQKGVLTSWKHDRGTVSKSSGKHYFEMKVTSTTDDYFMIGFASSGSDTTTYAGASNYSIGFMQNSSLNFVSTGFTSVTTLPSHTPASGDVYAAAIDFSAGKIWVAINNTWIGSGDPAAGTNEAATFVPATVGALFPAITLYSAGGSGGATWNLQSASGTVSYSPPSGFSVWG